MLFITEDVLDKNTKIDLAGMLPRAIERCTKIHRNFAMRLLDNRCKSRHDIYVGNRCYSAKTTLMLLITEDILDEIPKIP